MLLDCSLAWLQKHENNDFLYFSHKKTRSALPWGSGVNVSPLQSQTQTQALDFMSKIKPDQQSQKAAIE